MPETIIEVWHVEDQPCTCCEAQSPEEVMGDGGTEKRHQNVEPSLLLRITLSFDGKPGKGDYNSRRIAVYSYLRGIGYRLSHWFHMHTDQ